MTFLYYIKKQEEESWNALYRMKEDWSISKNNILPHKKKDNSNKVFTLNNNVRKWKFGIYN